MLKSTLLTCLVILCVSFLFIPCTYSQDLNISGELNKKIASSDLVSDLDLILEKISSKEYGRTPFNFVSENDFRKEAEKAKNYLMKHDSLTQVDFMKTAGPLIALLKDDHAQLKLANKWLINQFKGKLSQERFIIPLSTLIYNNACYVAASDTLPVKSKIVSINGIPVMDVIKETLRLVEFSIYNCINRNLITTFDFPKYSVEIFALYNFSNEVRITYIPYGKTAEEEVILPLYRYYDRSIFAKANVMPVKMDKNPSLEFRDNIAVIRIPSFMTGRKMDEALGKWLVLFEGYFREISTKKPEKLLIDLGNNGGGSELVGYILLKYLCDKKIKTSFYSKEFTPGEIFNESIKPHLADSLAAQVHFNIFNGKIYLLTSELSFSAAARFSDLFKTYSLGKIIGRETRGFRSHYGELKWYDLEKAGLGLSLSSKFLVSASGDLEPHGVIPDVEIKIKNTDDLFDRFGNDYLLNEAVKYISAIN